MTGILDKINEIIKLITIVVSHIIGIAYNASNDKYVMNLLMIINT